MVATSQVFATQAGLDILRSGGNAVDAAIAANAVLGLTEPTGCGIGGDLFAMVWEAGKDAPAGLNASGRAPRSLNVDVFRKAGLENIPARGPLPVSTPGAVDGWFELHGRYGRMDFAELLRPAIALAREGFPVAQLTADAWAMNVRVLAEYPGFADSFMPGGAAPGKGRVFRNPRLAATYELLAKEGREAFYRGEIAWKIAAYMRENGGYLDEADLASHASEWVRPVRRKLPRQRRLRPAPQHPGDRDPADPQPAGAARPRVRGVRLGGAPAPAHRGQETGVRGPGALLCRSRRSRRPRSMS